MSGICTAQTFTITPAIANVTCPGAANGSASVSVTGGSLPYTYRWVPAGQTTAGVTGLTAGNYSVTITDKNGIDSVVSIVVTQPQPIVVNDTVKPPACESNGYIVLSPAGGTSPYRFLWNTGETVAGITRIRAGAYSVMLTDANNCTASFSYPVAEAECFVTPQEYFTPNGDGINDLWLISNSQYFPDARLIVFDRWGTRVYEHRGVYEPWDGKSYLGIPVPDAAYYYFFYQDKDDKQKASKHGSVIILR